MTVAANLGIGQRLSLVKFLAYGWSSQRSLPAVRDLVVAALAEARHTGWDGLSPPSATYLDDFWDRADVELDGDTELQQAVRFALFHVLQAGRARGAACDRGQGPDRPRLRRPHVLGHGALRAARC